MTTIVTHFGLPDKEVTLLKSIFGILGSSAKFESECFFIDYDRSSSPLSIDVINQSIIKFHPQRKTESSCLADIIFVDADNTESLRLWKEIEHSCPLTTPVYISRIPAEQENDSVILQRPIMLKRVISIVESIVHTDNTSVSQAGIMLNVLVVDDSYPVRKYLEHTLPKLVDAGLKIEFASSGEEALEKVEKNIYGLVFLDVVMPGIDGYKVCKKIKSQYNCQVVMLTSKKSPFDKVRGSMSGCNAYITKPPEDEKLKAVLEKCLTGNSPVFLTANSG